MSSEGSTEVPLSSDAQDAKEMVQQQLLRKMAAKVMEAAIEEERQRRIKEGTAAAGGEEGGEREKVYNQLVLVQEDLLRTMNLMRVCSLGELINHTSPDESYTVAFIAHDIHCVLVQAVPHALIHDTDLKLDAKWL